MHANVEDRGIKGDITPLMAAANGRTCQNCEVATVIKLMSMHSLQQVMHTSFPVFKS